ncbi:MAG: hypothetical protein IIY86_04980 [Lachnospiraceae bacterium]|nr:hypothetical protein [Lachnospiraceae bacterium]
MSQEVLQNLDNAFQIAVILYVIVRTMGLFRRQKSYLAVVFFLLGMINFLASDLYWVTHQLMNPSMRLPFTASEMGGNGWFLLSGAALATLRHERERVETKISGRASEWCEMVFPILFATASTGLWIGWSGEWFKDILCGAAVAYFYLQCSRMAGVTGVFTRMEQIVLCIGAAVLVAMQTSIFFVPEVIGKRIDAGCYILMFAGIAMMFIKYLRAVRTRQDSDVLIALAFGCAACCISAMYMSADPIYFAADTACSLSFLMMLQAMRKKVETA